MLDLDVRRLAAVDMYGAGGTLLRRRVILAEFVSGTVVGAGLGGWLVAEGGTVGWLLGAWLLGLAVNYFVLALHAITLSRSGALDIELHDVDLPAAFRDYNVAQFWVFVPLLFAVLDVIPRLAARRSRRTAGSRR